MARVILFDIDNTLLYSGGAGGFAMAQAFHELYGVPDGFARVEFSGRTDLSILATALAEHGVEGDVSTHLSEFMRVYYGLLPASLRDHTGHLMPGFPELLEALRENGARLGLATGNFSESAKMKLEFFGIWDYFLGGGFGETDVGRARLVSDAIRSVANGSAPNDIIVIGDTPHDVTSALENGVVGIGVATGKFTSEELRDSGAHAVYQDFADWETAARELLAGTFGA